MNSPIVDPLSRPHCARRHPKTCVLASSDRHATRRKALPSLLTHNSPDATNTGAVIPPVAPSCEAREDSHGSRYKSCSSERRAHLHRMQVHRIRSQEWAMQGQRHMRAISHPLSLQNRRIRIVDDLFHSLLKEEVPEGSP